MNFDFLGYRGLQGTHMDAWKPSAIFWTKFVDLQQCAACGVRPRFSPCKSGKYFGSLGGVGATGMSLKELFSILEFSNFTSSSYVFPRWKLLGKWRKNCDEMFSQLFFPLKNLVIRESAEAEMKSARISWVSSIITQPFDDFFPTAFVHQSSH